MSAISVHRRDSDGAAAFGTAATSGAEYVEIDIRRAGDGVLIAYHDREVAGLPVGRCSYDRLCEAAGRPIPLVGDAMRTIAGHARGHLDLKESGSEHEAVSLAQRILGAGNFVVTTKDAASIALIKRDFPHVRTALSIGRGLWERGALRDFSPLSLVRSCGADMVALNHRLARLGVLSQCARAGFPAMVWTVNADPLMTRFLRDPRVAVLVTDRPLRALTLRATSLR